ncbi:MAG TPA: cobalt transporter CbiM [Aestuariivirga sp.]|nr:cobalt transporter CbiM [Aestuariivirga sp.]
MAHIPDGLLSLPVSVAGGVAAAAALAFTARRLDDDELPRVAVMAAVFFVASLITVPVGPTSIHLLLAGLMGVIIGWATIPAVFVGLVLQAAFFGFGGFAALGVNTLNIALPGAMLGQAANPFMQGSPLRAGVAAALAAAASVAVTGLMVAASLYFSDKAYTLSAKVMLAAYVPLLLAEATLSGVALAFLARVRPDMLGKNP